MRITFLGTGSSLGSPVIGCKCDVCKSSDSRDNRLRSSLLIQIEDKNILIDAGPDFREQMLRSGTEKLDAILISHEHRDHIGGLDDVRAINYNMGHPTDVFAEARVAKALRNELSYAFVENPYPGVPEINLIEIKNEPFVAAGIKIIPIRAMHAKLPIFGFRIEDTTYITDVKSIEDVEISKVIGSKCLIINALRQESHISHINIQEAIDLARKINAEKTFFTHVSHLAGKIVDLNKSLPEGMEFAYDNLSEIF